MGTVRTSSTIKVADEVWIAAALLHREHPDRSDFRIQEIVERASRENTFGRLRPGVQVHASLHCVANRPPNPGTYRMLYATGRRTRRLFRPEDEVHPQRQGKITPNRDQIPARYHKLLDWYETRYRNGGEEAKRRYAPLYALIGLGKEIWAGMDPDEYVRNLRKD